MEGLPRAGETGLNRRRLFQVIAIAGALAAYLTIIVGGDVRSSGAGMACTDSWPLCSGTIVPDFSQPGVAIEFAHRVIAFTTSVLVLITLILAFLWFRKDWRVMSLSVSTMALLFAQVLLGAVTVQTDLNPTIVTAHLALGTATFATALVLAVVALMPPSSRTTADIAPS